MFDKTFIMIKTLRAGWLGLFLLGASIQMFAQNNVQENLARADKQFDLYAYNLALRTYESVLQTEPSNARALSRIGDCYFQLNRPEEALPYYDRAVSQAAVDPDVMFRYGKALMQTGDYVGAKKWFLYYGESNAGKGQHFANMCDYAMRAIEKQGMYEVRNEPLNTVASDFSPVFYKNKVVYNSARNDIKRERAAKTAQDWTGSAYNQLYSTQRNAADNYLQRPAFLKGDLENNFNEGPVSFSADGSRVAFCRNNFIDGTRQVADQGITMSLYLADIVNGKWVNVKSFPYNGSDYATGFPCLSPDGNTLYFASNQKTGMGGWDIYVSNRTLDGWSQPQNLGAPLNTEGNEVTPFIDGNSLYFASDWHKGLGGLDVFRAEMNQMQVLNIFHLGPGINSYRDDYGFIYDSNNNIGYFTSNRAQGRGNEDIWQAKKAIEEFVVIAQDEDQRPLPYADVDFTACGAGIQQTDANGRYAFAVAAGQADCEIVVRKNGYISAASAVRSSGSKQVVVTLRNSGVSANLSTPPVTHTTTASIGGGEDLQQYTLLVTDPALMPLYYVEIDLSACGMGTYRTDKTGKVKFPLSASTNCTASLNREGYESVLLPIQANASHQFIVSMSPIGAQPEINNNPTISAPITYSTEEPVTNNSKLLVSRAIEPTNIIETEPQASGYAIQLAAGPGALRSEKLAQYDELAPLGNIYSKVENNMTKVRLGVYPDRAQAQAALPDAKKVSKDAFIVKESGVDESLLLVDEPLEPVMHDAAVKNPLAIESAAAAQLGVYFSVQVASLSESDPLVMSGYSNLSDVGNVYVKPENGMQKVRVGVWSAHSEAEKARETLIRLGHKDAIIVTEKADGKIESLLISAINATPSEPDIRAGE